MTALATDLRLWATTIKLSHSVFALPFALIAAFLAGRNLPGRAWPYPGQLALILLCMVSARSVAMTFNRIVDAKIDARNPRTAQRPLATGRLGRGTAWTVLGVAALSFVAGCFAFQVLYGNPWPNRLAVPVLAFLCAYSFTKRFTRLSHYWLGAALALAPLSAWVAVHPASVGPAVFLLMAAVLFWAAGFDIIYSCQDIAIDRRDGLYSLPSRVGPAVALWIARASHMLCITCLMALGIVAELGALYALGVICAALLLLVENRLVRPGNYEKVNVAFFTMNGAVGIVLAITAIADVLAGTVLW